MNSSSQNISSLFGLGRISKFPGTLASLASLIFSVVCFYFFNETVYILFFLFFLGIGFWGISRLQKTSKDVEKKDYSWIVIDEWIGMWVVGFVLFNHSFSVYSIYVAILAFIIFRLIDIFKFIPPIRTIDSRLEQTAHSIILDDIIAGIYTYAILMILFGFYNWYYLLAAMLFLLTPMIANATPVLLRKIEILNSPINAKFFGQNKTWRGLVGGTLVGILSYFILIKLVLLWFGSHAFPDISYTLLVGFLLSFGALAGDLIKSFFKRHAGVASGAHFPPWDQVDYVLGAIIFTSFLFHYSVSSIVLYLIIGGALSALAHRSAYFLKLINTKF